MATAVREQLNELKRMQDSLEEARETLRALQLENQKLKRKELQNRLRALEVTQAAHAKQVAELEKDGVANPEQVIKKRKIEERIESHMAENSQVEPEIRLKRFLYYGDERPLYQPWDQRLDLTDKARLQIERVQSLPKMFVAFKKQHEPPDETDDKNPPETEKPMKLEKSEEKPIKLEISEVKKAKKLEFEPKDVPFVASIAEALQDPGNPHPQCPIYCLAQCCRHPLSPEYVRTAAYMVARAELKTFEQLCLFIKFTLPEYGVKKEESKRGNWSGGMRRLVCHWYEQQDPVQLAHSVCNHSKQHGWSHKDLIRSSHLKTKDKSAGLQAVVCYALHGLETTEKEFGQNEAAHDVMQELRRRKLHLEAEDFAAMAKLVEAHGLKYEAVPSEKLKDASVWVALLKNMTVGEVLTMLPQITKLRIKESANVIDAAVQALGKEGHITPVQVYLALRNYLFSLDNKGQTFISAYWEGKLKEKRQAVRPPSNSLVEALNTLIAASFKAMEPAGVRVLVALDLRATDKHCTWTHSLSPLQAMAITALSLARTHKRFTLTCFVEGQEMQIISVPKSATIESLLEKFRELQATAAKEPTLTEPMSWARERKRDLDLFVIMTPELVNWKFLEVGKSLQNYRDTIKKPDARLAINALCHMSLHIGSPRSPGIFDMAGFGPHTIQIMNCIAAEVATAERLLRGMGSIAEQQDRVKEELFCFLRKHIPSAQLSQVDEIVLSYVVSILEELGEADPDDEQGFDVDGFCEMMAAYLPEFSIIEPGVVCSWMFELSAALARARLAAKSSPAVRVPLENVECGASDYEVEKPRLGSSHSSGEGSWEGQHGSKDWEGKRSHQLSETSDTSSDSGDFMPTQEEQAYLASQLQLLQEMFPSACSLEVRHCLAIAGGDAGQAAQLVLHRQEAGQSLTPQHALQGSGVRQKPIVDDQELKERIIARYSYIDKEEAKREHRPVAPKSEPKKLIRYRDNKIVSLKGERFTEVKKEDDEDSKKTYVSLKPARQYRFH